MIWLIPLPLEHSWPTILQPNMRRAAGDAGFIQDKIAELADSNWRVITNPLVELLI